jgi:hypothetical protein
VVRTLARKVKQNGIRFPEHETIILKRWHFFVRIESDVLRGELVASPEVDRLHLTIKRKMIFQGHDGERA